MPLIEINQKAPNFSGLTDHGKKISLSDFKGSYLVLYFYPKDDTPGCSREAQNFNAALPKLKGLNARVVGVSRDPLEKHEKFKTKYSLAFDLISDEDEKVCNAYDVIKIKKMFGKEIQGIVRSTFLIDPNGKIRKIWRNVKVDNHVTEVTNTIKDSLNETVA